MCLKFKFQSFNTFVEICLNMSSQNTHDNQRSSDSAMEMAIQKMMELPIEQINERIEKLMGTIDQLTPYITEMNDRLKAGELLEDDERVRLDQMSQVLKQSVDFVVMAKQRLMNKLMASADSYYYSIKAEAEKGNEEAIKIYENLKLLKQESIRNEFPENNN